jgi:hypothetical protein
MYGYMQCEVWVHAVWVKYGYMQHVDYMCISQPIAVSTALFPQAYDPYMLKSKRFKILLYKHMRV